MQFEYKTIWTVAGNDYYYLMVEELANNLAAALNTLKNEGYDVVSINMVGAVAHVKDWERDRNVEYRAGQIVVGKRPSQ